MAGKGGGNDFFDRLRGGIFDFNRDGKEDAGEMLLGFQIMKEILKEEEAQQSDDADFFDPPDEEWYPDEDGFYDFDPEEGEEAYEDETIEFDEFFADPDADEFLARAASGGVLNAETKSDQAHGSAAFKNEGGAAAQDGLSFPFSSSTSSRSCFCFSSGACQKSLRPQRAGGGR